MPARSGRMIASALLVVAGAILASTGKAEHFLPGTVLAAIGGLALAYDWIASHWDSRP